MRRKKQKLKKGFTNLRQPLYLNANLIYSEALNHLKKPDWKRTIRTGGTLNKLRESGYQLVVSTLTRMEVIQRLRQDENKTTKLAREVYTKIKHDHEIMEITGIHKIINLTDAHLDSVGASNLDFKDSCHLLIAKKYNMTVCTHDKKMRGNFSQHGQKTKFYNKVYKPEELIKRKK